MSKKPLAYLNFLKNKLYCNYKKEPDERLGTETMFGRQMRKE